MTDTFDYAEALADADELITFFGQAATLTAPGTTSGDAFNPTAGTPVTETCTLVEIDFDERTIDGVNVLRSDKRVLIKVGDLSGVVIAGARTITYGGVIHQVIGSVRPLNPGGTLLLYEAQVRV